MPNILQISNLGGTPVPPIMSETLLSPHQWGSGPLQNSSREAGGSVGVLVPKLRQPVIFRDTAPPSSSGNSSNSSSPLRPTSARGGIQKGSGAVIQTTRLWLRSSSRHCQLIPLFEDELLVLVLLHDHVVPSRDVLSPIVEVSRARLSSTSLLLDGA